MARETFSGVDTAWLHMDRPVNTADVVAVIRLEGSVSMARLRRLLERRLLVHGRFRQRIVPSLLGRPAWEDDPTFSLERHVLRQRIGGEAGALDTLVSAVASDPLDLRHPPWRIHLVDAPRGSAIVAKLHHCIADGFALVAVLLSMADEPAARRGAPPVRDARAVHREPWRAALTPWAPAMFAAALGRMIVLQPDPPTALKRALGGERRVAVSPPFPLRPVRAAAREHRVTVNEILSAVLAGALRRWSSESGQQAPARDVRALVPVNLRPFGAKMTLGNQFGLVFLDVPIAAPTSDERLRLLHERMEALKAGVDPLVTYGLIYALGRLPTVVEQWINAFFTTKASLVLTNVPGPRRALRIAGRRVAHVMFWVPHPASLGLGVSILTYAGEVTVGVRADAEVMPDPARLVRLFEAELRAIVPKVARGRGRPARRVSPFRGVAPAAPTYEPRPHPS